MVTDGEAAFLSNTNAANASNLVTLLLPAAYLHCQNQLQIRFLLNLGKRYAANIAQGVLLTVFMPMTFVIFWFTNFNLSLAAALSFLTQLTLFGCLINITNLQEDLKPTMKHWVGLSPVLNIYEYLQHGY